MIQGRGRNIVVSRVATICYNPTCAGVAVSGECVVLRRGDCRSDGPLLSTAQGECLSTCFSLL